MGRFETVSDTSREQFRGKERKFLRYLLIAKGVKERIFIRSIDGAGADKSLSADRGAEGCADVWNAAQPVP